MPTRSEKWEVVVAGPTDQREIFHSKVRASGMRAKADRSDLADTWRVPLTRLDDFFGLALMTGDLTCELVSPYKESA